MTGIKIGPDSKGPWIGEDRRKMGCVPSPRRRYTDPPLPETDYRRVLAWIVTVLLGVLCLVVIADGAQSATARVIGAFFFALLSVPGTYYSSWRRR